MDDRDNEYASARIAEWTAHSRADAADLASASVLAAAPISGPSLSLSGGLMLAWAVAVALLLARLVRAQLRFRREMRNAVPLDPQRLSVDVPELLARVGLKQPVRIVESSAVASPAIWGIVRPTLILPVGITATLSARQLEWALLHELAHVRRRDLAVSCFQRLVQIVHFANPAVWIANRIVNRLREFACDDLATSLCGGSPADPGEAFLSIVRHAADNRRRQRLDLEGALGVFDSAARASCFQRMRRLLDSERRVRVRLGAGSLCLLLLAGAVALPQIRAAADSSAEEGVSRRKERTPAQPVRTAAASDGKADSRVDFAVVIARHVLLLDGKEIVTWPQIEEKIAALPDPSKARPHLYITRGAYDAGIEEAAEEEIWRLRRDYKLEGHSVGSLSARSDARYDDFKTPADLKPDESLRVEGRVVDPSGEPVAGTEIILVTAADARPSATYYITLVDGRVHNPVDHVMTRADDEGRFALSPRQNESFSVIALHPEHGFTALRDDQFSSSRKVHLRKWAGLVSEFAADGERQYASLSTRVSKSGGGPDIVINQSGSDSNEPEPTLLFEFTHVPPLLETTISRSFPDAEGVSFSLPGASVSVLPGETRRLGLGPLSEQQRDRLERMRRDLQQHIQQRREAATPKKATDDDARSSAAEPSEGAAKVESAAASAAGDLTHLERHLLIQETKINDIRELRELKDVQDPILHGERISDKDLRELADYSPRMIGFLRTNVKGPGLKHLNGSALRSLFLVGSHVTDAWLENLPEIPTLRALYLSDSRITDAGLKHLSKFPNLTWLNVSGTQIGDDGMKHIARLSRLEGLSLNDTRVSDEGLASLKALPELEYFSLASPNVEGPGLGHLLGAPKLERLQFTSPHATDEWLRHVEPLRTVTWMELHSTSITDEGLASLSEWKALREIYLNRNQTTRAGESKLRRALPDASIRR